MASYTQSSSRLWSREALVGAGLFVATTVLFWPAIDYGFLYLDDGVYVYDNPQVRSGLSGSAVRWALTSTEHDNWHPLTWLSLQLDCTLDGLNPRVHHLTNVLLHASNAGLLFWAMHLLTGAMFRSFIVAALFAWHPLHVESTAWIAERKDVLSAMFWMLAMIAYGFYARRPSVGRYLPLLFSLALGLAAKSMLVTLPCVLLLLDFWPLRRVKWSRRSETLDEELGPRRYRQAGPGTLLLEKVPLFALSAFASWLTILAQSRGGAMESIVRLPLDARCANAAAAYFAYLGKMFWPARLAAFYPHLGQDISKWQASAAVTALIAITAAALFAARRWPHVLVGWLWYLGALVPVIGLVQVGQQSMADRYTYLPLIGVWIALVWQAELAVRGRPWPKVLMVAAAATCLACCMVASRRQLAYWRDDRVLWEHALAVTENNYFAEAGLAQLCLDEGRLEEAERHAANSVRIRATSSPHLVLGNLELRQKRLTEAERHFHEAIRLAPDSAEAYNSLGAIYAMRGRFDEALEQFVEATQWKPDYAMARNNAGLALMKQRKFAEAIRWFSTCTACDPSMAEAYANLGDVFYYLRDWDAAIDSFRRAAELQPDFARHRCKLAAALWETKAIDEARRQYRLASELDPDWIRRTADEAWQIAIDADPAAVLPEKGIQLARQACEATDPATPPRFIDVLAAAYANAGQFDRAASMARRAMESAISSGDRDYAQRVRQRLAGYEQQRPFRRSTPDGG